MGWINLGSAANDGTGDTLRSAGAKLNKLWVPIAEYDVAGLASKDVPMDVAYRLFRLTGYDITTDEVHGPDGLTMRLSSDGGSTFAAGSSDYQRTSWWNDATYLQSTSATNGNAFIVNYETSTEYPTVMELLIRPGSASMPATFNGSSSFWVSANKVGVDRTGGKFSANGRQDFFRIGPFFGDGVSFATGIFLLEGLPV